MILTVLAVSPGSSPQFLQPPTPTTIEEAEHTLWGRTGRRDDQRPALRCTTRPHRGRRGPVQGRRSRQLVMSGRNPEPAIMRDVCHREGVPAEDILLDDGGIRTYATCYNTHTQLGLDEAIFVTQPYHLPRTLFLCRSLGIEATGVAADHGKYWRGSSIAWNIRETLATMLAFHRDLYLPAGYQRIYHPVPGGNTP